MYGNVNADLLWLRLLDTYLMNECKLERIKAEYCILYKKDDEGKL